MRAITKQTPDFFVKLSNQQNPEYLWIGCADSRVPANEIVGLLPGEMFVHRNVANVVVPSDLNCLSVLQYAVDYLKVRHVMVVGHYGCGGVKAALLNEKLGLIDNWLRHVQDAQHKHYKELQGIDDPQVLFDRVCELNVIEQVLSVCQTTVVEDAWARGQDVTIHSLIYSIKDGLLRDLGMSVNHSDGIYPAYKKAVREVFSKDHSLNPYAAESSMDTFTDVIVNKAANIYFDGKVTSRTLTFADGTTKTLGIMLPGEYEFGTGQAERMEITSGFLLVKLPGSDEWEEIRGGQSFEVPANVKFQVAVQHITDYVCSYL